MQIYPTCLLLCYAKTVNLQLMWNLEWSSVEISVLSCGPKASNISGILDAISPRDIRKNPRSRLACVAAVSFLLPGGNRTSERISGRAKEHVWGGQKTGEKWGESEREGRGWLVGAYARRQRRRRHRRRRATGMTQLIGLPDMQLWIIANFFDIGHRCYGQLTPVISRYALTCITWAYRGLILLSLLIASSLRSRLF